MRKINKKMVETIALFKDHKEKYDIDLYELYNRNCYLHNNDMYTHTDNDGDYHVSYANKTIYIHFEQTDSLVDWWSNFYFPPHAYKDQDEPWRGHAGFLNVYKSMNDAIIKTVKNLLNLHKDCEKIVVCGYSHGAALSGFCTEDMQYLFGDRVIVLGYGFGCPRFTWGILPKKVKERFSHFYPLRNFGDLVTHVPPAILGYGWGKKIIQIGLLDDDQKKPNMIDSHRDWSISNSLDIMRNQF